MGSWKYIQDTFQQEFRGAKGETYNYKELNRLRLIEFRKEKRSVVRIQKPTNLARARKLGYKAKKGIVVARVKIRKGSGIHPRPKKARRPKRMGVRKLTRKKSIQSIAEERAARKFPNFEVLNSYYMGEDGQRKYFEVILVNPSAPEIKSDRKLNWLCSRKQKRRVHRGKTSAGKKSRGLHGRGRGREKVRPSLRAKKRKAK